MGFEIVRKLHDSGFILRKVQFSYLNTEMFLAVSYTIHFLMLLYSFTNKDDGSFTIHLEKESEIIDINDEHGLFVFNKKRISNNCPYILVIS